MFNAVNFLILFMSIEKLLVVDGLDLYNKRGLLDVMLFPIEKVLHFAKSFTHTDGDPILPEAYMNTVELIESRSYRAERHYVTTTDEYKIEIHRIISPNCLNSLSNQHPIVIQPGILDSSSVWVLNEPNQSLGFLLADACLDVWLSNTRGSVYGNTHKRFKPESKEFWDFTFEDLALKELASIIDHVLNFTNHTQINYIAHSMGTTMGLVLLSMKPQYNHKINTFFALAPVAYLHNMRSSVLRIFASFYKSTAALWSVIGSSKYFPSSPPVHILDELCIPEAQPCVNFLGQITGPNPNQFNTSRISVYIHHLFHKTSIKSLIHYAQIFHSKLFQRFDYGWFGNNRLYKQATPPLYPLENITSKTIFFCGENDYISTIEDVKILSQRLPHHKETNIINDAQWNHMDFITAINASNCVYNIVKNGLLSIK